MIDLQTGCMEAELDWLYSEPENRRMVRYNTTYCYGPTKGTPFSSGVSVPYVNKKYFQASPAKSEISLKEKYSSFRFWSIYNSTSS